MPDSIHEVTEDQEAGLVPDQELGGQEPELTEEQKAEKKKQAEEFLQHATDFNQAFGGVINEFQDKLSLAHMAKVCFSTAVDLIMNQSAIQTRFELQNAFGQVFAAQAEGEKASRLHIAR